MALKRRDLLLGSAGMAAGLAAGSLASGPASAQARQSPTKWHREADVVVIGSGPTGLPAAIVAQEAGSSVILVEAEKDIGGHAITSCRGSRRTPSSWAHWAAAHRGHRRRN
jgi:heterodisulfide reductase subunit A-like polyferredoxin